MNRDVRNMSFCILRLHGGCSEAFVPGLFFPIYVGLFVLTWRGIMLPKVAVMMFPGHYWARYQVLSEFCPSLVDGDCMADDFGARPGSVGEFGPLHPGTLKAGDAVYCIEKPQKANSFHGTAESFSKIVHEVK